MVIFAYIRTIASKDYTNCFHTIIANQIPVCFAVSLSLMLGKWSIWEAMPLLRPIREAAIQISLT